MNPANSQQALAQLQMQQKSAQNPNDILAKQRQQLGVQGAQDTVTGLRGAINNTTKLLKQVAPSVMGRTGSSLVTNAQATRQIANEQAPISENLTSQGREYSLASEDLSELQRRAAEAASGEYQGQQDKLSYAQNLYNTLYQREQAAEAARQAELDRREAIRQFNEQLKLQKQAEARARAAASGGGFSFGGGGGGGGGNIPSAKGNASQAQAAYNDIMKKTGGNDARIISDYLATAKSAQRGNAFDKIKVGIYAQKWPQLIARAYSPNAGRVTYSPTKVAKGGISSLFGAGFNRIKGNIDHLF